MSGIAVGALILVWWWSPSANINPLLQATMHKRASSIPKAWKPIRWSRIRRSYGSGQARELVRDAPQRDALVVPTESVVDRQEPVEIRP